MTTDDRRRTANKFRWLNQVGADSSLTPLCFRLAYALVTYVNRTTGDAWPSQPRLAGECHASDRAIRDALTQLRDAGHLEITGKGGRGKTSHFRPIILDGEKRNDASTLLPAKVEAGFRDTDTKPGRKRLKTREKTTAKRGSQLPTIPLIKPIEETIEKKSTLMSTKGFDEWWAVYPKKVDKLRAEKAYIATIKSKGATEVEMLEGARRYAAAKAGTERRYVKHPASWLNAGGWLDEPEPISTKPSNRADSAIEGMRGFFEEGYHGE